MNDTPLQRFAAALMSRPFFYELVQDLAGQGKVASRLRDVLARLPHLRPLDVGSSAGGLALRLGLAPVCLDLDPRALAALRRRAGAARPVAGDAASLPFPDGAFDLTLLVAVCHHLEEGLLPRVVGELARVTSGHLVVVEPLRDDARPLSRWLWRYDRGRQPRTRRELLEILEKRFRVAEAIEFAVYHRYLLGVFAPLTPTGKRS
jgi:SAM-dependent methyltransferase